MLVYVNFIINIILSIFDQNKMSSDTYIHICFRLSSFQKTYELNMSMTYIVLDNHLFIYFDVRFGFIFKRVLMI